MMRTRAFSSSSDDEEGSQELQQNATGARSPSPFRPVPDGAIGAEARRVVGAHSDAALSSDEDAGAHQSASPDREPTAHDQLEPHEAACKRDALQHQCEKLQHALSLALAQGEELKRSVPPLPT